MNRIDTALARASNRALARPGRAHIGRAGQVEVIAVVLPREDWSAELLWVAVDIDLSLDDECRLIAELQANDNTSPGPVD